MSSFDEVCPHCLLPSSHSASEVPVLECTECDAKILACNICQHYQSGGDSKHCFDCSVDTPKFLVIPGWEADEKPFIMDRREAYLQEAEQQLEAIPEDDWPGFVEFMDLENATCDKAKGVTILADIAWRDQSRGAANYDDLYADYLESRKV